MRKLVLTFASTFFMAVALPVLSVSAGLEDGRCFLMSPNSGPCLLNSGTTKFEISTNGFVEIFLQGGEVKSYQVPLPEHFYVEAANAYRLNNRTIFAFEITGDDAGSSMFALFEDGSHEFLWAMELGAFNASSPLIEDEAIYVSGIGTIAKIETKTGKTKWKHSWLYERDTKAFNSFLQPRRDGETIIFPEDKVSTAKYSGVREIWVDDASGKMVKK